MTLKALNESIEHWERLRDGATSSDEGISSYDCDLCQLYLDPHEDAGYKVLCDNCPVGEFTGEPGCGGTPYNEIYNIFKGGIDCFDVSFQNRKKRIEGEPSQRMVDFLNKVKTEIYGK